MSLVLKDVSIALAGSGREIVSQLSLSVSAGEILSITGASGSGKSTLLSFVAGHLDSAFRAKGHILVDGRDVTGTPAEQRRIGLLFQDDMLFPHLSVGGNLAFGLKSGLHGRLQRRARIESALRQADLAGFYDRDPATLSGGQRARVALLRALLAEPKVLLLDEPFSKLDPSLREDIRSFVFTHALEQHLAILLVTHDEADIEAAGGRVLALS